MRRRTEDRSSTCAAAAFVLQLQTQYIGRVESRGTSWQVYLRPAPRAASPSGLTFLFLQRSPEHRSVVRPLTVEIVEELLGKSRLPPHAVLRRELEQALSTGRQGSSDGGR